MIRISIILLLLSNLAFGQETKPSSSKPKTESLDLLICPEVADKFISSSQMTLRSMQDLLDVLIEQRKQHRELFVVLLQLDKRKTEDEDIAGKIVDLKKGLDQKLTRAKLNYNSEIKTLATNLPKAKKCWSYHTKDKKALVARFLEIFQKEPLLKDFKGCIKMIESNNQSYLKKFNLSVNFYNKISSQANTILESKKIDKELEKTLAPENNLCQSFLKGGDEKYLDYFEGRYDHNKASTKSDSLKPSSTSTPSEIKPWSSKDFGQQMGL